MNHSTPFPFPYHTEAFSHLQVQQEYGLQNFTFEILLECNRDELNEKEKYFISLYQADTYGYNGNIGVNKK